VNAQVRHFSPAETARRFGVSVKALRVYERRGLLKPLRTAAGWRAYGPDQIAALHQILALRGLGLSLGRIRALLADKPVDLDQLLALQEAALTSHRRRLDQALALVSAARAKLKAGDPLSIDDLTNLAKETAVSEPMTDPEWANIFVPLTRKYFNAADLKALDERKWSDNQADLTAAWNTLISDCRTLMAKGDSTSPEAMNLAGRWMEQVDKFTQGDPKLYAKSAAMWKEATTDPLTAPKLPINTEMFAFIGKADAARRAKAD
jgi:DNA-binding transcriptional MerR regulator